MDNRKRAGGKVASVAIEGPYGRIHGAGRIIASADAARWRPLDCAPTMRATLFARGR